MRTVLDSDVSTLTDGQKAVVLELMRSPQGITTEDVSKNGWVRFSGTLEQLRKKGYIIKTVPIEKNKKYLYKLLGIEEPQNVKNAFDKLYHTLCKNGHKDVAEKLADILAEAEVNLRNKQRSFN